MLEAFLIGLQILPIGIVLIAMLIGLSRGLHKSLISLAAVLVTLIVSILVTPFIANAIAPLLTFVPVIITPTVTTKIVAGLIGPVLFLALFLLVNTFASGLITISTRKMRPSNRLLGMLVGLFIGVVFSIGIMMPINGLAAIYDDLKGITELVDFDIPANIDTPIAKYNNNPLTKAYKLINVPMFAYTSGGLSTDLHEISTSLRELNRIDLSAVELADPAQLTQALSVIKTLANSIY